MSKRFTKDLIPDESIINKIYIFRGMKVMIDHDLAELYKLETRRLNEQVKRNKARFPSNFMFQLSKAEFQNLKSQNATSGWGGRRTPPFVFTEHGILMLANVVKSERAIAISIRIIELFVKMRALMLSHKDVLLRLEKIEGSIGNHSNILKDILTYIELMESEKQSQINQDKRKRIGYIKKDE